MDKLTPVEYTYKRFATEAENEKEWYVVKDGMLSVLQIRYTKLSQDYTVTLSEAKEVYNRLIKSVSPKEGESISNIKFDLTKYLEYNEDGTPKLANEECPHSHDRGKEKTATYNSKLNRLTIWENGLPVYENYDGTICRDEAALADTYM